MSQEKSSVIQKDDFHPLVIRKEDRFCVYLPEWRISGEGDTLEDAYCQFEINLDAFEEREVKFGLASVTPEPYPALKRRTVIRELALSFGKAAAGAAAVILVAILLLPNIGAAFRNQAKSLVPAELRDPGFWAFQLPSRVNSRLDSLQPAEAEQMIREWSKLSERAAPMLKPLTCTPQVAAVASRGQKK